MGNTKVILYVIYLTAQQAASEQCLSGSRGAIRSSILLKNSGRENKKVNVGHIIKGQTFKGL